MRSSIAVSLMQKNYTTVKVRFLDRNPRTGYTASDKEYTYKARPAEGYKVGDFAVVFVSEIPRLVEITEVHEEPQIDIDLNKDYKWIVQRIDTTQYDEIMAKEKQAIEMLDRARRQEARATAFERIEKAIGSEEGRNLLEQAKTLAQAT